MPRKRKPARAYRQPRPGARPYAEIIASMAHGPDLPDAAHPLLIHVPEADRAALIDAATEMHFTERAARRLPILRENLKSWPVEAWGMIFNEAPELEAELNVVQRIQWQAWKKQAKRREPIVIWKEEKRCKTI